MVFDGGRQCFKFTPYHSAFSIACTEDSGPRHGFNACSEPREGQSPGAYKAQTREHLFKNCPQWKSQQKPLWAVVGEETGRCKDRFKISELFVDEMQQGDPKLPGKNGSRTEVGRTAGPPVADEEPDSEASEWEKREREEYLAQVAEEERVLGVGRKIRGRGLSITFSFSFSHFLFHMCQPSKGGGMGTRRPHCGGDLRRIRSGGKKVL